MTNGADGRTRRHDLDWLRVGAFGLLILYHIGMFFVPWDWHVKNPESAGAWLQVPMFFIAQWRLPLLFLVSGAAVHFALGRRTGGQFVRDRIVRLLVPLVFGMLVIVPPQVYHERLAQGADYRSYLEFLPDMLAGGPYPEGNLSWHHLWFVAYALVFSLLALPLFLRLRTGGGRAAIARAAEWLGSGGRLGLLAVPIVASEVALRPAWPSTHALVGDWANLSTYFIVFVYGHVLYSMDAFGAAVERSRRSSLFLGLATSVTLLWLWQTGRAPAPPGYTIEHLAWLAGRGLNVWFWLLALVGYARRYLNRPSKVLPHATEAVYPFYILHQTVIVMLAYRMIDWEANIGVKFVALTLGTVVTTTVLFLLLRRHPVTRVPFGMKPGRKSAPDQPRSSAHAA